MIPHEKKVETLEEKIEKLRSRLQKSVEEQEFEVAAQLRDEIKALEKEANE